MRMPALWPSQPLHARRLDLPAAAAPLNRETAEALSAWAGEIGALVYSGHGASGKQVWLFTGRARTGALWVKRCTSTQRRLPTRWIAVFRL